MGVPQKALRIVPCMMAVTLCACAALMADRKAQDEHRLQMVKTMDTAHLVVTTASLPKDKPYKVLGELKYTEPYTPDALDEDRIEKRLKTMALAQYSEQADAVIEAKGDMEMSGDTATVIVTGKVVQFESSADREMMHQMWDNLVVSPK
ncbi:MAG TPA: hypothetical protein VMH37_09845 [Candidatus Binataceae bacterium]|nr:hypothetical protein [Candidatus Binataceae bacterium]